MAAEDRVLILLEGARFILKNPERWCRREPARTEEGIACDPTDPRARAFNVAGALERVLFEHGYTSALVEGAPARILVNEAKALLLPGIPWQQLDAQIERTAAGMAHAHLLEWLDGVARLRREGRSPVLPSPRAMMAGGRR